jgi:outer membrane protein assembly factor BamB
METRSDNTSANNIRPTGAWYQTAVQTAIVGGAFSLIIIGLCVFNYIQRSVYDVKRTEELDRLKIEILKQSENEALISHIRRLDLRVRRDRIRRLDFSRRGIYLLVAGIAVLLTGVKCASTLRKKPPSPQPKGDNRDAQMREGIWARWAVTIGLVVLGSGSVFLALRPRIDFSDIGMVDTSFPSAEEIAENWPRFRGPAGLGISPYTNAPANWNGTTAEGILWKTKVPLPGHNSPVVWEDRVFLSGADANTREVYCFDASSGKLLWQQAVEPVADSNAEPLDLMEDTGFAAPTVVTDGRRVCAIFANGDVGCFDIRGKKLWTRSLGVPESSYGYASSLAMYRNLLLIQYDQTSFEEEKSRFIALNAYSGQPVWEMKRPVSGSWTSPIVARIGDRYQLITCSDPWVIAYDPINGAQLWKAECMGADLAPSPIYANGLVFAVESNIKLVAIRPDGRGDVTKTHITWSVEDGIPDICSPVSDGKRIFLLTSDGTLTCYQVADGAKLWEKDLGGDFKASPSLAGGRLYALSEKGVMLIAEAGEQYRELARNELGEDCHASPAFADGRIYVRGLENLYCIGEISQNP